MKINWFTVIAQVINFLILVWLLKRFLYKPILKAVDEREKTIAAQLTEAEQKKATAEKEQEEFRKKNEAFDQQKKSLTDQVMAESKAERKRLFDDARQQAQQLRENLNAESKANLENMSHEIAQKTQAEVFAISKKMLAELASVTLEEQIVNVFIARLHAMTKEEKKIFLQTLTSKDDPISIRSAFELPEKQQTAIKKTISNILGNEPALQFTTEPEVISGIELAVNGYKLAWSISEYLQSLQQTITSITKDNLPTPPGKSSEQEKSNPPGRSPSDDKVVETDLKDDKDKH